MEYLELKSSKYILERVKNYNGQYDWYGIISWVDRQTDSEYSPSSFEVLKKLTSDGYLEMLGDENQSRYFITEKGRRELEIKESN